MLILHSSQEGPGPLLNPINIYNQIIFDSSSNFPGAPVLFLHKTRSLSAGSKCSSFYQLFAALGMLDLQSLIEISRWEVGTVIIVIISALEDGGLAFKNHHNFSDYNWLEPGMQNTRLINHVRIYFTSKENIKSRIWIPELEF